jgi:lipopolysaccharide heptosyltransferase I
MRTTAPTTPIVTLIRLGAFGDIVHTLPAVADLHAAGVRVRWVVEDRWACLLEGSPAVAELIRWPRKILRTGSRAERRQAWRQLRQHTQTAHGLVIDAHGLAKSAALSAGLHPRLTHAAPRARELSWLLADRRTPCRATHVIDQQRALIATGLRYLGLPRKPLTSPWEFPLPPWQEHQDAMRAWLDSNNLSQPWTLNVGAGWPSKIWPIQHQIQWAQAAVAAGQRPLILWGSPAEKAMAEQVHAAVPTSVLAPPTSIPEVGALLHHCGVLVSGDTGPLHLGLAVGCPTIGLFGPVPAERNGPRGPHTATFQGPGIPWERKDPSKGGMDRIDPQAVAATCAQLARQTP